MEKYIPYEKLSKKEQRKVNAARRNTWGEINPVTRKPQNSKAYNRNKARRWKRETHETNAGAYFIESRIHYDTLDRGCIRKINRPLGYRFS